MFENEDKFPSSSEYVCPPIEAQDAEGMILYKFNNIKQIPSDYMEPMIIKGRRKPKNGEQRCQMCGHSVFLNYDFIQDLKQKSRTTPGVIKKWKHIYQIRGSKNSKILPTPSNNLKNHHTYWHFGERIKAYEYEYIGEIKNIEEKNKMEG